MCCEAVGIERDVVIGLTPCRHTFFVAMCRLEGCAADKSRSYMQMPRLPAHETYNVGSVYACSVLDQRCALCRNELLLACLFGAQQSAKEGCRPL